MEAPRRIDALMRRLSQPAKTSFWAWTFFRKYPSSMITEDPSRNKVALCTICLKERLEEFEDEGDTESLKKSEVNYGKPAQT